MGPVFLRHSFWGHTLSMGAFFGIFLPPPPSDRKMTSLQVIVTAPWELHTCSNQHIRSRSKLIIIFGLQELVKLIVIVVVPVAEGVCF